MVDLWGLTGNQVFIFGILAALLCSGIGIFLWAKSVHHTDVVGQSTTSSMIALVAILSIGSFIGYMRAWVASLLLFAVALLLVGIMIGRRMTN